MWKGYGNFISLLKVTVLCKIQQDMLVTRDINGAR